MGSIRACVTLLLALTLGLAASAPAQFPHDNTVLGEGALPGNTGVNNTALGARALGSNTMGVNNTATGQHALLNNTTAGDNTAVGSAALLNNTTGSEKYRPLDQGGALERSIGRRG